MFCFIRQVRNKNTENRYNFYLIERKKGLERNDYIFSLSETELFNFTDTQIYNLADETGNAYYSDLIIDKVKVHRDKLTGQKRCTFNEVLQEPDKKYKINSKFIKEKNEFFTLKEILEKFLELDNNFDIAFALKEAEFIQAKLQY